MTRENRECWDIQAPSGACAGLDLRGKLAAACSKGPRTSRRQQRWMPNVFRAIGVGFTLLLLADAIPAADEVTPPAYWDNDQEARELGQWRDCIYSEPPLIRLATPVQFSNEPESLPPPMHGVTQQGIYEGIRPIGQSTVGIEPAPDPKGRSNRPEDNDYASSVFARQPPLRYNAIPAPVEPVGSAYLAAADFCHLPLYFEEAKLERYGHCHGIVQPAISAAHFFGTTLALPYRMVVERPRQCLYHYYPYEAGRWAPPYCQRYPLRLDAGFVQAATVVGLIAIIP